MKGSERGQSSHRNIFGPLEGASHVVFRGGSHQKLAVF